MEKETIKIFLDEMFSNQELFIQIHGISKAIDPKYMLIADYLSEELDKLAALVMTTLYPNDTQLLSSRY